MVLSDKKEVDMMDKERFLRTLFVHAEAAEKELQEHCHTLAGPELDETGRLLEARCLALDGLLADLF